MERVKEVLKKVLRVTTNLMNKYLIIHFYGTILPLIFIIAYFYYDIECIAKYEMNPYFPFIHILIAISLMFFPALLWFIITKIFKKIYQVIIIFYFLLFVIVEFSLIEIGIGMWAWKH